MKTHNQLALVIAMSMFVASWSAVDAAAIQKTGHQKKRNSIYTTKAVPADVLAAIKASQSQGDVYGVTENTQFAGQILKAKTISFKSGANLVMTDTKDPWIAIVAETYKFDAPSARTIVHVQTEDLRSANGAQPPKASTPGKAPKQDITHDGNPGAAGGPGAVGGSGAAGHAVPTLYVFTNKIVAQSGAKPDFLDLRIDAMGADGGNGSSGQDGQNGGDGGDGGDGEMGNPFQGCRHSASNGGPGGAGGNAGTGGAGGQVRMAEISNMVG